MRQAILSALCAALLLGACAAVGPDYERPATGLPGAYPDAPADLAPTAAIQTEWWKLYADPMLDELVANSLERNADVRLAVARIEEADANLREAGAAFLPAFRWSGTTFALPWGRPSNSISGASCAARSRPPARSRSARVMPRRW